MQKRFLVKNTNMMMASINKVQFASLIDKMYYFSDGIVSLPFRYPSLSELRDYKKSLLKIHTVIINCYKCYDKLLQLANKIVNNDERLRVLRSIFSEPITYCNLKSIQRSRKKRFDYTTVLCFKVPQHTKSKTAFFWDLKNTDFLLQIAIFDCVKILQLYFFTKNSHRIF